MITTDELALLRVPLSALPGLDPVGLWVHHCGVADMCAHAPLPGWVRDPSVDLADASTADRVARWRALQCAGIRVGPTAPAWIHLGYGAWGLAWVGGRTTFCRSCCLPEGVDPDDSRRLPDGSRYVDRLALARVAVTSPHRGEA